MGKPPGLLRRAGNGLCRQTRAGDGLQGEQRQPATIGWMAGELQAGSGL